VPRPTRLLSCLILLTLFLADLNLTAQAARGQSDGLESPDAGVLDQSQPPNDRLLEQLRAAAGGRARIALHAATGLVRFIGTDSQYSIAHPAGVAATAAPEPAARAFLKTYGALFGLRDQAQELRLMRAETLGARSFVRFQQVHAGVPVLGGELIVQLDGGRNVLSTNSEILPNLQIRIAPTLDEAAAVERARAAIAKSYGLTPNDLKSSKPQLWLYNPVLLGGPGPRRNTLTWRMEVRGATATEALRELVLVDAQSGIVALHFNQIADAKSRRVCNTNNVVDLDGDETNNCDTDAKAVRLEGQAATGNTDVDLAYDYSGDTYDYYFSNFGRDSLDGNGLKLVSLVKYCPNAPSCPYANAFWDGQQMTYGDGFASADDVVGHELTHGFTEFTSHLFYYYQSGAINESLSDVFGELIDQGNGKGTDTPAVRWQLGEDLPGGAIRNMQNPLAFGDPDRTGSTNYYGGELDSGGVHSNSGVNNKAAFLMTDGGSFNGYTISGLGAAKVGQIYYRVETQLLTSASDYQDLGDALQTACASLVGSHGITAADCTEVAKVVQATQMDTPPTNAPAIDAPVCAAGQTVNNAFYDNLENTASGNWASSATSGANAWYYPANPNPYNFDAQYSTSGTKNFWGYDESGGTPSLYNLRMTANVTVPANAYLHFRHAFDFEHGSTSRYDGGIVQYSINGGASWSNAGALFKDNGYNATLSSFFGNPLGGQQAFGGVSRGYISSRADLSSLAGQNVRFGFSIGTDNSGNDYGWFIDDVRIYTCTGTPANTAPTATSTGNVSVVQGGSDGTANVATVADAQDAAGSLSVAATGVPAGISVTLTNTNGTIAATARANCAVVPGAYAITLTVTDSGGLMDSVGFNVIVSSPGQLILDPSFEAGIPNAYWGEGSTNFGTPICNAGGCGTGGGTAGPRTGSYWAWFGGIFNAAESGFVTQTVDLPSGPAQLSFYIWIGQHNGTGAASYVRALMDSTEVFSATDAATAYDAGYTLVNVDVSAFGGGSRTLRIEEYNPSAATPFNVNIDDVTLTTDNHACLTTLTASLTAASQSVSEAAGTVTIVTTLNRTDPQAVSVPFTVGGTASGGNVDHDLANGTISIPAGQITGTLTFNVIDDTRDEPDETIVVTLGTPANATLGAVTTQTITIQDNDPAPTVALSQGAVQVDESAGTLSLIIQLSAASNRQVTVQYATGGGTATAGSDYTAQSGTLTFAPGTTSQTIVIPIANDGDREPDETFVVTLSAPAHAGLGATASTTVTISDNDSGYQLYLPLIHNP
jgi:bacillolysin